MWASRCSACGHCSDDSALGSCRRRAAGRRRRRRRRLGRGAWLPLPARHRHRGHSDHSGGHVRGRRAGSKERPVAASPKRSDRAPPAPPDPAPRPGHRIAGPPASARLLRGSGRPPSSRARRLRASGFLKVQLGSSMCCENRRTAHRGHGAQVAFFMHGPAHLQHAERPVPCRRQQRRPPSSAGTPAGAPPSCPAGPGTPSAQSRFLVPPGIPRDMAAIAR